jgi:hypothetical protein
VPFWDNPAKQESGTPSSLFFILSLSSFLFPLSPKTPGEERKRKENEKE